MKKYAILGFILTFIFFISPVIGHAQTLQELQQSVIKLQAQLAVLQQRTPLSNQTISDSGDWCYDFTKVLYLGFSGPDVAALQTALQKLGFFPTNSPITGFFGPLTINSLIAWQASAGIFNYDIGVFDNPSREKMNSIFACATFITLNYPNGGETLYVGDLVPIGWTSVRIPSINQVQLNFKPVGGTGSITIAYYNNGYYGYSLTPSSFQGLGAMKPGLYNLTISTIINGQTFSDTSDTPFTISAQPSSSKINVLAPNGGEVWQMDSSHIIRWTPNDPNLGINPTNQVTAYLDKLVSGRFVTVGRIVEFYTKNTDKFWSGDLVGEFQQQVLVQPDPQLPPYYTYNPPPFFPPPGDYYIRVVSNTPAGLKWDRSDRPFTLVAAGTLWADLAVNGSDGPITVPLGGAEYDVSWESNTEGCIIYNHTQWIDYNSPPPDSYVTDNLPPAGIRRITILPPVMSTEKDMGLICNSTQQIEGYAWDIVDILGSGGVASITNSPVVTETKIMSPNGGETVSLSNPQIITWQATSEIKDVSLALYKNDAFVGWIARSLPAAVKAYRWTPSKIIPSNEIGNNVFKIYLLARQVNGVGAIADKSDRPFRIVNEPVQPIIQPPLQPIQTLPDNLTPLNNTDINTNTVSNATPTQPQPSQPPVVSVISSTNPPKEAIDARQRSDWNKVRLYFSPALPAAEAVPDSFSITSTNQTAPQIISLDNISRGRAIDLNLNRTVLPGERILITYKPSDSSLCLGALPGDVNGDSRIMANDLSSLRASLAGEPNSLLPLYRTDINSDGIANAADDASLMALLHARSATSLNTLPACPAPMTLISNQNQLANTLSALSFALQTLKQAIAR